MLAAVLLSVALAVPGENPLPGEFFNSPSCHDVRAEKINSGVFQAAFGAPFTIGGIGSLAGFAVSPGEKELDGVRKALLVSGLIQFAAGLALLSFGGANLTAGHRMVCGEGH